MTSDSSNPIDYDVISADSHVEYQQNKSSSRTRGRPRVHHRRRWFSVIGDADRRGVGSPR